MVRRVTSSGVASVFASRGGFHIFRPCSGKVGLPYLSLLYWIAFVHVRNASGVVDCSPLHNVQKFSSGNGSPGWGGPGRRP